MAMVIPLPVMDLSLGLTKDGGKSWVYLASPIGAVEFNPQDQNTIYSATGKSTDLGKTWQLFNLPSSQSPFDLTVDPRNGSILYVLGPQYGILKSTDAGASWAWLNGAKEIPAIELKILEDNPRVMYVGSYRGVFKSTDGGQSWSVKDKIGPMVRWPMQFLLIDIIPGEFMP